MNLKYYLKKAKDVNVSDILSVFPMIFGWAVSAFQKNKYKETWAICERKDEARDNGYWFFKYMCEYHPEQHCVYVINPTCKDAGRVRKLGEIVTYGSLKHWVLYFNCKYLISSQSFSPNSYMCTFLERSGLVATRQVFLQHGITKDIAEFLLASHRKVKYFIAGAEPEFEFMKKEFGYPEGTIKYTGFARFDSLHHFIVKPNRIMIMPTWRKWLVRKSEEHDDAKNEEHLFDYINGWKSLLTDYRFINMIKKYKLDVVFYVHPNMKGILDLALFDNLMIKVAHPDNDDIQDMLKSSQLLITDYSSVFFDMVYMKKPVVFYQFDEEKYRKYHYQQGWYDYHNTSFGKTCKTKEEVTEEMEKIIRIKYHISDAFLEEHSKVFPLFDTHNCMRIYDVLKELGVEK